MTEDFVRAVQEYVHAHMAEPIAVHEIAAHVGLHPSYLNTLFHARTGSSVKTYIHAVKTEEAKRMLCATTRSISEIGTMLGYFDQSHFTRVFKKYAGMTPAQYRLR